MCVAESIASNDLVKTQLIKNEHGALTRVKASKVPILKIKSTHIVSCDTEKKVVGC